MEQGFTEVYALRGGWDAWVEAGYPTEQVETAGAA
jgi:rhodanese-related sulfurtransferase